MIEVEYPDELGRPLLQFGLGESIWAQRKDVEAFKRAVKDYCALCLPGWTVVRTKYPNAHLRDDRGRNHIDAK